MYLSDAWHSNRWWKSHFYTGNMLHFWISCFFFNAWSGCIFIHLSIYLDTDSIFFIYLFFLTWAGLLKVLFLLSDCFLSSHCLQTFAACRGVHEPGREAWSSRRARTTRRSRSSSKREYFFSLFVLVLLSCFHFNNKSKRLVHYTRRPLKLNKEIKTSLVLTLVNYFLMD